MSDSEEEDFMSDAFLAKLEPSKSSSTASSSSRPQTYQEKRRAQLAASEAKNKRNGMKSYREREEDARREAMETTLFEKAKKEAEGAAVAGGGGNGGLGKAMGMMEKMGYRLGEGLGRKRAVVEVVEEKRRSENGKETATSVEEVTGGDGSEELAGLGSSKKRKVVGSSGEGKEAVINPTPAASFEHRFEPIAVSLWAGRKGIGHKAPPPPPSPPHPEEFPANIDPTEYRSRSKSVYEEKKAEGQLRSARATCVELDERDDRGFSILHLNPTHLPSFPPPLLHYLTSPSEPYIDESFKLLPSVSSFPSVSNHSQAELLRLQMAGDSLQETPSLEEAEEDFGGGGGLGGLKAEREAARDANIGGREEMQVQEGGNDEEDWEVMAEEARKFIALPASDRLALTLSYLRSEFRYCFYCGCDYPSAESLKKDCPGTKEEDHD